MLWVARENWPWLLLAAVLGAVVSTVLTLRRTPTVEAAPVPRVPSPAPVLVPDLGPAAAPAPAPEPAHEPAPTPTAVKAKRASRLFHTEDSPNFTRVHADEVFATEDDARAAGYHRWDDPDRPR